MRIKELEDVLKLVDRMPRERQLQCVKDLAHHVEQWEERVSFDGNALEFLVEKERRRAIRKAAQ